MRRPKPRTTRSALKILGILTVILIVALLERRFHLSAVLESIRIEERLRAAGPLAPLLFVLVMALTVVTPLPTFPLDFLAGRLFGPLLGTLLAVTGATLGALISFFLARWLGRDLIAHFLKGHINFCQQCSDRLLTKVVLLARLIPLVSFDVVSYGSGLTSMSATRFALASFTGMLPLTLVYVSFGPLLSVSTPVAWTGGALVVALFFLLPRWVEKHDPFSVSRLFEHTDTLANGPGADREPED